MSESWNRNFKDLEAFKKKFGHCNVPLNDPAFIKLGRWVAAQRYKRRICELPLEYITALDALGFTWSPNDVAWEKMFRKLVEYKKKYGTTDIPERCPGNQKLASWVHSQRHRRNCGILCRQRIEQLDSIGFRWAVPKRRKKRDANQPPSNLYGKNGRTAPCKTCERLYYLCGRYIQYGGRGRKPLLLADYIHTHGGVHPPYLILPAGPVVFYPYGNEECRTCGEKVFWSGRGALPATVLAYVVKNGVLPPFEKKPSNGD